MRRVVAVPLPQTRAMACAPSDNRPARLRHLALIVVLVLVLTPAPPSDDIVVQGAHSTVVPHWSRPATVLVVGLPVGRGGVRRRRLCATVGSAACSPATS